MITQTTTFLFPINIGKIMYGELQVTAARTYNGPAVHKTELEKILYQQNDFGHKKDWVDVTNLITIATYDLNKELMDIAGERFYEMEHENDEPEEDEDPRDGRYGELEENVRQQFTNYPFLAPKHKHFH